MEAVTTREAADILEANPSDALSFLKAANIPHRKIESGGRVHQYLWDAAAVTRLKEVLNSQDERGNDNED